VTKIACVAIDYSLFIGAAGRRSLHYCRGARADTGDNGLGHPVLWPDVAIGLLAMLVLGLGNIGSLGLAGTMVVALSVVYGLTFLPAVLAILGPRVNALSIPMFRPVRLGAGSGFWHRLSAVVMAHPWRVLAPVTALLLLLGSPFLHLRLGAGDVSSLPRWAEARRGTELLRQEFPGMDVTQIIVVVSHRDGSPLQPARIGQAYDLSRWLAALPGVSEVQSVMDLAPDMSREDYQRFVKAPRSSGRRSADRRGADRRERIMVSWYPRRCPQAAMRRAPSSAPSAAHAAGGRRAAGHGSTADLGFIGVVGQKAHGPSR
jgi:RND superfamily putative drug exporter